MPRTMKGDITEALMEVMADARDKSRVMERALTQDAIPAGSGTGTVTSVAMTVPSIFSVSGSPITVAGTLAVTLANQSANQVLAGPIGGGAAAPAFRALVAADIPALSYGAGTVTSVALSLPGIFSVSGSPVTGAGTLTGALATQTANYIWAGPTTGAAAAPTFRAMVVDDVPNALITYAKIQNMTTARLLGRTTAGAGVVEEISVGAGLTLAAGVLDTVGSSPITGSGTDTYLTRWTGASSIGDSALYLSSGMIVSASSNSGLKVARTGADSENQILADAAIGYTGSLSLLAIDRDGGGVIVHRAGFSSDSLTEKTRVYGHLTWQTDATYDIGATGATRPRDAYLSRSLYAASIKLLGSGSGTATITPPAAAGTPTLTLPTASGTLALTSDIPSTAVATKTADYTLTGSDGTIVGDSTAGDVILSLPTAASRAGKAFEIKSVGSANSVYVIAYGTEKVEAAYGIRFQYFGNWPAVIIRSDGSRWLVIADFGSGVGLGLAPVCDLQQPAASSLTSGVSTVDFGSVVVGDSSSPKTFTIQDDGRPNLGITSAAVGGGNSADFPVDTSGMAAIVAYNATTTFSVTFTPASSGARSTTLTVTSTAGVFTVTLTGTGTSSYSWIPWDIFVMASIASGAQPGIGGENSVSWFNSAT